MGDYEALLRTPHRRTGQVRLTLVDSMMNLSMMREPGRLPDRMSLRNMLQTCSKN